MVVHAPDGSRRAPVRAAPDQDVVAILVDDPGKVVEALLGESEDPGRRAGRVVPLVDREEAVFDQPSDSAADRLPGRRPEPLRSIAEVQAGQEVDVPKDVCGVL